MTQVRASFLLKLPPEMHTALSELAAKEYRSMNAQIVYMLRNSLVVEETRSDERPATFLEDRFPNITRVHVEPAKNSYLGMTRIADSE